MYEITNAKCAMTGGGCYTFWGKTKEYYYLSDIEGTIYLYDTDTNEFMDRYFNDENFDAYEWEQIHRLKGINIDNRQFLVEMFDALGDSEEMNKLRRSFLR